MRGASFGATHRRGEDLSIGCPRLHLGRRLLRQHALVLVVAVLPGLAMAQEEEEQSCNWQCYVTRYPDLQATYGSNIDGAAQHYETHGRAEGRDCTCRVTPYMKLAYGAAGCRWNLAITTQTECANALTELGYVGFSSWAGVDPGIPKGCSVRESPGPVSLYWNEAEQGGARSDLAPICLLGSMPILFVSIQTLLCCVLTTCGALLCVGVFRYCGRLRDDWARSTSTSDGKVSEHSLLLDNAKVFAQFLVVYTHILYYSLNSGDGIRYNDTETWLSGAQPMMEAILTATAPLKIPLIAFISGICSQGRVTVERIRRYITNLVVPTLFWVFLVKPVVFEGLLTLDPRAWFERVTNVVQLRAFHEEFYLQALVLWRGSTFLLWSHLRPQVAFVIMLALSCSAGYMSFGGRVWFLKLDETFGFLPYFAVGYVFPFSATTNALACNNPIVNMVVGALIVLWCVLVPFAMPQPLPDSHGSYSGNAAGAFFGEATSWDRHLWWTQRVAKLVLEMIPTLALLLFVLPRSRTPLTWIGEHTLYPFLFHLDAHAWRSKLLLLVRPPVITHKYGHVLVLILHVFYAIAVLIAFASQPFRRLFQWCFKPTWIESLIFEPSEAAARGPLGSGGAGTGECGDECMTLLRPETFNKLSAAETGDSQPEYFLRSEPEYTDAIMTTGIAAASPRPVTKLRNPERTKSSRQLAVSNREAWHGGMPTWTTGSRIPHMQAARDHYWILLPLFTALVLLGTVPPIVIFLRIANSVCTVISWIPTWVIGTLVVQGFILVPMLYIYHYFRLRGSVEVPSVPSVGECSRKPLTHCVVIVAYKEPVDVMCRTFSSILNQEGIQGDVIAVFAGEARDHTRHEVAAELQEMAGDTNVRFILTEHVLQESETVGKSSNENYAVREIYRTLVEEEGYDPFEVMVTICDADSIFSRTYLANVERHFYEQPDGRRIVYSGPLNVYRNFGDGCLLAQTFDMGRCHQDAFFNPLMQYHPQSNYSLTLGLCWEIDFWTPDNMPEDVHTGAKVRLVTFGSSSTMPIESFICNDLVETLGDRYTQAKRHQWGVTDFAWQIAIRANMDMSFYAWLSQFRMEIAREGSFISSAATVAAMVLRLFMVCWVCQNYRLLPRNIQILMLGTLGLVLWRYVLFWTAEAVLWNTILKQFDIKHPSIINWMVLVVFSPILVPMADIVLYILPTIHCLLHVTFVGELGYVCAPKGERQKLASPLQGKHGVEATRNLL